MKPVVCTGCGSVLEGLVPAQELDLSEEARKLATREIVKLTGRITRLENSRWEKLEADPYYPEALELYEYWKAEVKPGAKEFTGARLEKVMARLHAGHSLDDLKQAVNGCKADSWYMEHGHNDLALICRDDTKVLGFIASAPKPEQTSNGAGPTARGPAPKEVQRLEDRIERLKMENAQLEELAAHREQDAVHWRASYHEALDYLTTLKSPLAAIAEDSMEMRFRVTA